MRGSKNSTILASLRELGIQPNSVTTAGGAEFGLVRTVYGERLAVLAPKGFPLLDRFAGETASYGENTLLLCSIDARSLEVLRELFPWLRPQTLRLSTSVGFGDRLGLATPGHVCALREAGGEVAPIFAQQSIREMERTGRTPQQVLDDATWGAFATGWRTGFGADADHLKTTRDIDVCARAGYTFFTFDPGEYVDDRAEEMSGSELNEAFGALPWEDLQDTPRDLLRRYRTDALRVEGHEIRMDETALLSAAVKYGRAIAHAAGLYRHLAETMGERSFEVEVSVDETGTPTTHAQHVYVVTELRRLGVEWVSLAPRYVGRFEKGVDYIGDVAAFEADVAVHAAIARALGPYKLSLHSGSDKFSIYPAFVRQTQGMAHLKTAGTSYLEALRTVAALDPPLFREVYSLARERYAEDRASYHVSAEVYRAPAPEEVMDGELPALLEQFDAREILHVTFGSVLREGPRERLFRLLRLHSEAYKAYLEKHFVRHLKPFANATER